MGNFYALNKVKSGFVHVMEHAGFKASLMRAKRIKGEGIHNLPSGIQIPVFPLASLPGAPKEWVREAGSYVCPVDTEWGLWFDFTMNDDINTAIMVSVKGINPITGQKIEGFGLEQYADKCPVHNEPFTHERHCEKCGYKWVPQSYLSHPNILWLDGFKQPDGSVRQFFFTDEDKRDVASLVIGKENTVPAFGFVFYRPKNPRTPPKSILRGVSEMSVYPKNSAFIANSYYFNNSGSHTYYAATHTTCCSKGIIKAQCVSNDEISDTKLGSIELSERGIQEPKQSKDVSVGAGAQIRQDIETCSLGVNGWQEQYSGIIRLYFCFEEQFNDILSKGGIKDFISNPDKKGYLKNIPVG